MDGRPDRRNKAAFLNFSYVVPTLLRASHERAEDDSFGSRWENSDFFPGRLCHCHLNINLPQIMSSFQRLMDIFDWEMELCTLKILLCLSAALALLISRFLWYTAIFTENEALNYHYCVESILFTLALHCSPTLTLMFDASSPNTALFCWFSNSFN